jgi:TP901 family phage tail tape measure protein
MTNVGNITATLTLNAAQFNQAMQSAQNQMATTSNSANKVSKDIQAIHNAALALGGAMVVGVGAAVTQAANFEQKMADVKSVSGATADEMSKLGDLAKEMGMKTAFSATEAAGGIEELIKAGLTVEQIINGGLEASLNLAVAGNLQLAEAAEIASTALNSFKSDGLSAATAADILAGAANASATDVQEMKFGLSMVSAVASGIGLTFRDTATSLALFAQNGLKGKSCPLY